MQPVEQFVDFNSEEAVSSATYEAINDERVHLSKPVTYLSLRKVERAPHAGSVPTHQRVESKVSLLRFICCKLAIVGSPTILREIKEIKFPKLQWLFVSGNLTESVEGLSQIHLPKLAYLQIGTSANI